MAIYHHSVSIIKRSAGKSAVAAAAYRSGQRIADERTGIIHDYTKKIGIDYSVILTPIAADWIADRQQLWNKIEATEKRYDARLSREVSLALPTELDRDYQIALVHEYVRETYVNRGMIADINFHNLESNNPHVHVMLSLRELKTNEHGQVYFGNKNRDWDARDLLIQQRQNWEVLANQYLADAGYDQVKIDCRSLEAQGINRVPQIHLGCHAASMRAKGIPSRIGDEYDRIEAANNDIRQQLEEIYNYELAIVDLDGQCKILNAQISDLQTKISRDLNLLEKVDPDVLAAIKAENQVRKYPVVTSVDREDLIKTIGGDERAKRIVQWCSKNLIIPDGQNKIKRESNSITAEISAINVDSQSIAYVFTDIMRQDKLTITCGKSSGIILSMTGLVTGRILALIKKMDDLAIQEMLRGFRRTDRVAEPEVEPPDRVSIPETQKIGTLTPQVEVSVPEPEKAETLIYSERLSVPEEKQVKATVEIEKKLISRRRSNQLE